MILYQLKKSKLQYIEHASFKAEKEIQSIVEENVEDIFNLRFVFSEYIVGELLTGQSSGAAAIVAEKLSSNQISILYKNNIWFYSKTMTNC